MAVHMYISTCGVNVRSHMMVIRHDGYFACKHGPSNRKTDRKKYESGYNLLDVYTRTS